MHIGDFHLALNHISLLTITMKADTSMQDSPAKLTIMCLGQDDPTTITANVEYDLSKISITPN